MTIDVNAEQARLCSRCYGIGHTWVVVKRAYWAGDGRVNASQPAPTPAEPAEIERLRALLRRAEPIVEGQAEGEGRFQNEAGYIADEIRAALAAAPAPQPDADTRKALVAVIREGCKGRGWLPNELPVDIADALLADGWTRRREEGR